MIRSYVGPMFSGKTTVSLGNYKRIWNKEHVMCFKPRVDTRDIGIIKSREFKEGIEAICIDSLEEIFDYLRDDVRTIFIDEIQFLKGSYRVLSYLSIVNDIDIYVSGLNMDTNLDPFGIVPQVLSISDEVINLRAVCYDCNKEASFTYNETKDEVVKVGDEGYIPLCRECLVKRIGKDGLKKKLELKLTQN